MALGHTVHTCTSAPSCDPNRLRHSFAYRDLKRPHMWWHARSRSHADVGTKQKISLPTVGGAGWFRALVGHTWEIRGTVYTSLKVPQVTGQQNPRECCLRERKKQTVRGL